MGLKDCWSWGTRGNEWKNKQWWDSGMQKIQIMEAVCY